MTQPVLRVTGSDSQWRRAGPGRCRWGRRRHVKMMSSPSKLLAMACGSATCVIVSLIVSRWAKRYLFKDAVELESDRSLTGTHIESPNAGSHQTSESKNSKALNLSNVDSQLENDKALVKCGEFRND